MARKPQTIQQQFAGAVQLGVPEPLPSSARPAEATPTGVRLACAEEWLRAGAGIGVVAEETGLSRHVVRVLAQCVMVGWHWEPVMAEDWELRQEAKG